MRRPIAKGLAAGLAPVALGAGRAASSRDPLTAYADLWVLCRQMTAFFETGAGRDLFGPYQPLALTTARTLEARMETTFAAMFDPGDAGPKLQWARGRTTAFAQAYPIESLSFRREPLTGHPNILMPDETKGLGGLATNVEQD